MMGLVQYQLQLPTDSTGMFVAATFGPTEALLIGAVTGYFMIRFTKFNRLMSALLVASFALTSTAALLYFFLHYSNQVVGSQPFAGFASLVGNTRLPALFYGNPGLAAAAVLIGVYEAGLVTASSAEVVALDSKRVLGKGNTTRGSEWSGRGGTLTRLHSSQLPDHGSTSRQGAVTVQVDPSPLLSLGADERRVMELFIFNRVEKLQPKVDFNSPEGYSFQEIPGMDWGDGRLMRALDSLERRGFLRAELVDKVVLCKSCGSAALQLSSGCPECGSVNLTRHQVIEHFVCGLIDKQEAFDSAGGELVCPKCHRTLGMVGSDYRNLSPMYICQECNAMNKDLSQVMKCLACQTAAPLEEEKERPLYSYELNEERASLLRQQIKPVEAFTSHFRSRGYTVVSPAVIVGRSGARHTFDLAIMASPRNGSDEATRSSAPEKTDGTAIEILISSTPIGVEEISAVYGKVDDLDCPSMIFVTPGLTEDAHSYAASSSLNVFEGTSIEEALAKSDRASSKAPGERGTD